jgi:hypothetical protein
VITLLLTAWLGTLFVYSGALKVVYYDQAAASTEAYVLIPKRAVRLVGWILPWLELVAGGAILTRSAEPLGPALGIGLGAMFAVGSSWVLVRGIEVPCGCTGHSEERVKRATLVRAASITFASLGLLLSDPAALGTIGATALAVAAAVPAAVALGSRIEELNDRLAAERHWDEEVSRAVDLLLTTPPDASDDAELAWKSDPASRAATI